VNLQKRHADLLMRTASSVKKRSFWRPA